MLALSGCKDESIRQVKFVAICTFFTIFTEIKT